MHRHVNDLVYRRVCRDGPGVCRVWSGADVESVDSLDEGHVAVENQEDFAPLDVDS